MQLFALTWTKNSVSCIFQGDGWNHWRQDILNGTFWFVWKSISFWDSKWFRWDSMALGGKVCLKWNNMLKLTVSFGTSSMSKTSVDEFWISKWDLHRTQYLHFSESQQCLLFMFAIWPTLMVISLDWNCPARAINKDLWFKRKRRPID